LRGVRWVVVLAATLALGLHFSSARAALAGDATLGATLDKWSRAIGADARAISLAAEQRNPRRMTASAVRFRRDALRAHAALGTQHATTPAGRQGRALALHAFANYAVAGAQWAASGRARRLHHLPAASALAHRARTYASRGNRQLVAASRLIP
jgi:hypothetical protein